MQARQTDHSEQPAQPPQGKSRKTPGQVVPAGRLGVGLVAARHAPWRTRLMVSRYHRALCLGTRRWVS
ncbi:hypothetical protein LX83_000317 [Goodfellowiella coeruleoviolacea]|uniref:Uncharacterized protein n=1 Tax=Goodfellowiella coeruleoviolacea TaxID=334858 RepID=A0AAE3KE31_9PSEU|nr:hypothetical protein [Goodfellowiella coeruleoviolacea]